jgi:hypothetical protein
VGLKWQSTCFASGKPGVQTPVAILITALPMTSDKFQLAEFLKRNLLGLGI